MQSLPAAITSILAADEKQPSHLYRLTLTNIVLRMAASKTNIVFPTGGDTYYAKAVKHEAPRRSIYSNQVGSVKIDIADGNQTLFGYHKNDPFEGKHIEIIRVFRDALGSADNWIGIAKGRIASVSWNYQWFTINVTIGKVLRQKLPKRGYTVRCPWRAGGDECNYDGNFDISQAPLAQSGEDAVWANNVLTIADRDEADDYWKHARIVFEYNGYVWRRKVIAFSSGNFTLDFPLPIASIPAVTYTLLRGCDGSWSTCQGSNAWGPSADNHDNYGGFRWISETEQG